MVMTLNQHNKWLSCTLFILLTILELTKVDANVCNSIAVVENATPKGNHTPPFAANTVIEFTCKPGFAKTAGRVTATCRSDGASETWDLSNSKCRHKSCGQPGGTENGMRIGEDFRFGESVLYKCYPGYEMNGIARLYCDVNGQWTNNPPQCRIISCDNPPNLANGSVNFNSVIYESVATYSCNNSFRFVGTTERTVKLKCSADRSWNGTVPACEEVLCPSIPEDPGFTIIDLSFDKGRHPVGKKIYYKCENEDITIDIVCTKDGKWSSEPHCRKETFCPEPPDTPGIKVIHVEPHTDKHKVGQVIYYLCQSTGTRILAKCKDDGTWSELPGECEAVIPSTETKTTPSPPQSSTQADVKRLCGEAPYVKHGIVTSLQSTATYKCESGYTLEGQAVLTCLPSRKWDKKPPFCKKALPIGLIIGVVVGIIALIGIVVGAVVLFHKKRKSSVPANKIKASPTDAINMDEVLSLDKNHRPIPITVL